MRGAPVVGRGSAAVPLVPLMQSRTWNALSRGLCRAGYAKLVPCVAFGAQYQDARVGPDVAPLGPEPPVGRDPFGTRAPPATLAQSVPTGRSRATLLT